MRATIGFVLLLVAAAAASAHPADSTGGALRISCPQPMRGDRRITISFAEAVDIELALYDLLGRRIGGRDVHRAGRGTFVWNLAAYDLAAGTYLLVADHRNRRDVRKLLLLR